MYYFRTEFYLSRIEFNERQQHTQNCQQSWCIHRPVCFFTNFTSQGDYNTVVTLSLSYFNCKFECRYPYRFHTVLFFALTNYLATQHKEKIPSNFAQILFT